MNNMNLAIAAIAFETISANFESVKVSVYGKMQVKFRHLPFTLKEFLDLVKYNEELTSCQNKLNLIASNYFWDEVAKNLNIEDCEPILPELNYEAWEQYEDGFLSKLDVINLTLDALALRMKES